MRIEKGNPKEWHCAVECPKIGVYRLVINPGLGLVLCTEHANQLCSLEMPGDNGFRVVGEGMWGVPYCSHSPYDTNTFKVLSYAGQLIAQHLCEDCALAIVSTLEARQ